MFGLRDAEESLTLYESLSVRAYDVYEEICQHSEPNDPSARRVWESARRFVACGRVSAETAAGPHSYAPFAALDKLLDDWPELHSGELTGEIAYASEQDLWARLMCEPPMGTYASFAAALLNRCSKPGQIVVELGAGVGNTSRLLDFPKGVTYIRTDKRLSLMAQPWLPGRLEEYDFDNPPSISGADIVFAVNSLHCARHPRQTLAYIRSMLRPGGLLIIAEGEPKPTCIRPWVLDAFFCQFSGWWDRSGFRERSLWLSDLAAEGYVGVDHRRLLAGDYDLGGVILGWSS